MIAYSFSLKLREECRLRRIFGPKRDENGEWRRLHNEELDSLYRSPIIVRVIKSKRLRWAGHIASLEEDRCAFKIQQVFLQERDLSENVEADRTILKLI